MILLILQKNRAWIYLFVVLINPDARNQSFLTPIKFGYLSCLLESHDHSGFKIVTPPGDTTQN